MDLLTFGKHCVGVYVLTSMHGCISCAENVSACGRWLGYRDRSALQHVCTQRVNIEHLTMRRERASGARPSCFQNIAKSRTSVSQAGRGPRRAPAPKKPGRQTAVRQPEHTGAADLSRPPRRRRRRPMRPGPVLYQTVSSTKHCSGIPLYAANRLTVIYNTSRLDKVTKF